MMKLLTLGGGLTFFLGGLVGWTCFFTFFLGGSGSSSESIWKHEMFGYV